MLPTPSERAGVIVRMATSADVPTMAALRVNDFEVGPADSRMAAYLDGRHHPQQAQSPRTAFLAELDGATAGYIAGHLTERFGCDAEIQYLYVAPAFRRTGVAAALLRHLAAWFVARRAVYVCVDVNPDSSGAEAFYSSLGATWLPRGATLDSSRAL